MRMFNKCRIKYRSIITSTHDHNLLATTCEDLAKQMVVKENCVWTLSIISSREGEQWLKMRSVLRQKILKPKDVAVYSDGVNEVVTDLIKRIHTLRSQEDDGETVTNVNNLFFKYSMEGKHRMYNVCKGNGPKASRLWSGTFVK